MRRAACFVLSILFLFCPAITAASAESDLSTAVGFPSPILSYWFSKNVGSDVKGSSEAIGCFIVETEAGSKNSYLTISQTKGVMNTSLNSNSQPSKTRSMYEWYTVTVETLTGENAGKTERFPFTEKTIELEFAPQTRYRVTLLPLYLYWSKRMEDRLFYIDHSTHNPYSEPSEEDEIIDLFWLIKRFEEITWYPRGWEKHSTWNVSGTKRIKLCEAAEPVIVLETPATTAVADPGYDKEQTVFLSAAQPGDLIYFGRYEQNDTYEDGSEPIVWLVLEREGDRLLVISKYSLFGSSYQKESGTTWEDSDIRKTLNHAFFETAFSDGEAGMIQKVTVEAHRNPTYEDVDQGKSVPDRIFLLSVQEARRYFANDQARMCRLTEYALNDKVPNDLSLRYSPWWLRSAGSRSDLAAYVRTDGFIVTAGHGKKSTPLGVRPAMWIDTAKAGADATPASENTNTSDVLDALAQMVLRSEAASYFGKTFGEIRKAFPQTEKNHMQVYPYLFRALSEPNTEVSIYFDFYDESNDTFDASVSPSDSAECYCIGGTFRGFGCSFDSISIDANDPRLLREPFSNSAVRLSLLLQKNGYVVSVDLTEFSYTDEKMTITPDTHLSIRKYYTDNMSDYAKAEATRIVNAEFILSGYATFGDLIDRYGEPLCFNTTKQGVSCTYNCGKQGGEIRFLFGNFILSREMEEKIQDILRDKPEGLYDYYLNLLPKTEAVTAVYGRASEFVDFIRTRPILLSRSANGMPRDGILYYDSNVAFESFEKGYFYETTVKNKDGRLCKVSFVGDTDGVTITENTEVEIYFFNTTDISTAPAYSAPASSIQEPVASDGGFHTTSDGIPFFADDMGTRIPLGFGTADNMEERIAVSLAWEIVANTSDVEEYGFYDVDKDGKKELILKQGTGETNFVFLFFRYSVASGQFEYIGKVNGFHSVLTEEEWSGTLMRETGSMGDYSIYRVTLKNGILQETLEVEYSLGEDEEDTYDIGYSLVYMCIKNIYHSYIP